MTYTADTWPIACAMLPFGGLDSAGGPIQDAAPSEWARQLGLVRRLGFTEVDPTDTWVRVGELSAQRPRLFAQVVADSGLTIPAISTSRRSVMDPVRGAEYRDYSHRLLDNAAELGVPLVSYGFFQGFSEAQGRALWFWLESGWIDDFSPAVRERAVAAIRGLAEHAHRNGQQISLEMYEDTYVGTADDAVAFLADVNHPACGLNPDLGNLVRLHRPIEPIQSMLDKTLPHATYWHVKNYLRDEDPATGSYTSFPLPMDCGVINYRAAITQAVAGGFTGPFLTEHYGSDSLGVCARNRDYIRSILATIL